MTKDEYILRSFANIKHKKWELFVVSRILHSLNDTEIEFVCQQLVRLKDGKRALADLYFPQFNLLVEVDEAHHRRQPDADKNRERDIVNEIGCVIERIKTADSAGDLGVSLVAKSADKIVRRIKKLKRVAVAAGRFTPWDYELRYDPAPHIEHGEISLERGAVFRRHQEAMRCFGYEGGDYMKGRWPIPNRQSDVWFPKLYPAGDWKNDMSPDGLEIVERWVGEPSGIPKRSANEDKRSRVTFARGKSPLGEDLYRFVGVFRLCLERCGQDRWVYMRETDRVKL